MKTAPVATPSPARIYVAENRFYHRLSLGLAGFILVVFAVFDALTVPDPFRLPFLTHVHAASMVASLALFLVQGVLGAGRNLPLHRKLGWIGVGLAMIVVVTGIAIGHATVAGGRVAPVFTPPYFLGLTTLQPLLFGALVAAAILFRRRTDWHRRLMLGALVLILEPAVGRLTILTAFIALGGPDQAVGFFAPRPLLIPAIEMAIQLSILAAIMAADRSLRGTVHPALWWVGAAVAALYAGNFALAALPPFAHYAEGLAGSMA